MARLIINNKIILMGWKSSTNVSGKKYKYSDKNGQKYSNTAIIKAKDY